MNSQATLLPLWETLSFAVNKTAIPSKSPRIISAAWHTELRAAAPIREVAEERQRVINFVRLADAERRWRKIIHIGIGGRDWRHGAD